MRLVARIAGAAAGALLFSQSAEFAQQYLQRLGGAADELRTVVERFDAGASAEGFTRERAIERLKSQPDPLAARQGRDAEATTARFEAVATRYRELLATAPLLRPFALAGDPDTGIAARALEDFRPALPVTPDGLALTSFGFLAGWGLGAGLAGVLRANGRRRRAAVT